MKKGAFRTEIEKDIYMKHDAHAGYADIIDAKKLLDEGKLIQVRPHTRFVHFQSRRFILRLRMTLP